MGKNNRQQKYGDNADWYLHPTKGFKRKRPAERAHNRAVEWRLSNIFKVKGK
jgi:hypothetical protein